VIRLVAEGAQPIALGDDAGDDDGGHRGGREHASADGGDHADALVSGAPRLRALERFDLRDALRLALLLHGEPARGRRDGSVSHHASLASRLDVFDRSGWRRRCG